MPPFCQHTADLPATGDATLGPSAPGDRSRLAAALIPRSDRGDRGGSLASSGTPRRCRRPDPASPRISVRAGVTIPANMSYNGAGMADAGRRWRRL